MRPRYQPANGAAAPATPTPHAPPPWSAGGPPVMEFTGASINRSAAAAAAGGGAGGGGGGGGLTARQLAAPPPAPKKPTQAELPEPKPPKPVRRRGVGVVVVVGAWGPNGLPGRGLRAAGRCAAARRNPGTKGVASLHGCGVKTSGSVCGGGSLVTALACAQRRGECPRFAASLLGSACTRQPLRSALLCPAWLLAAPWQAPNQPPPQPCSVCLPKHSFRLPRPPPPALPACLPVGLAAARGLPALERCRAGGRVDKGASWRGREGLQGV